MSDLTDKKLAAAFLVDLIGCTEIDDGWHTPDGEIISRDSIANLESSDFLIDLAKKWWAQKADGNSIECVRVEENSPVGNVTIALAECSYEDGKKAAVGWDVGGSEVRAVCRASLKAGGVRTD